MITFVDKGIIFMCTVEYGKSHFPHLSSEEHFQRVYSHIQEKYGENGYLKLWLKTDKNTQGLVELQSLLNDKEKLKGIYHKYA